MKTIKEWLEELPEEYREKALNNCSAKILADPDQVESVSRAIRKAFVWADTPEGHLFWVDLLLKLEE